nr:hypothetical protein [Tanacetum cinerariifolium]
MDADDQAIQTILLGLTEDVYAAVNSCEIAKEIWERVRQMMKVAQNQQGYNAWQNGGIQGAQNAGQNASVQNGGNQNGLVVVPGIVNQSGTGNVVAARAEGTGIGNQARLSCSLLKRKKLGYSFKQKNLTSWLLQASTSGTQLDKAPVYDIDSSAEEVDLEARIKDLENILLKRDQTVQTMHMLNPKPDSFYHSNQKMPLGVFVPQTTKSKEELFLSNVSNMVTVSKTISIPNEDISDDTALSVTQKFLNEVKSSLVTLQRVFKPKMTLKIHNWLSSAHKEEVDESLDKQKSLELKIERLLKASVSHDIMSIVQNGFVDASSDLRTELDRTKEKLELFIIKKEKEYDVLWNNWYTKCKECKYDKISYDKAYNDMQQKVERLQAQLRDLKGKISHPTKAEPRGVTY